MGKTVNEKALNLVRDVPRSLGKPYPDTSATELGTLGCLVFEGWRLTSTVHEVEFLRRPDTQCRLAENLLLDFFFQWERTKIIKILLDVWNPGAGPVRAE